MSDEEVLREMLVEAVAPGTRPETWIHLDPRTYLPYRFGLSGPLHFYRGRTGKDYVAPSFHAALLRDWDQAIECYDAIIKLLKP